MSTQITEEIRVLLYSICLGFGMSFFYDIFRILRNVFRHGTVLIALQDLLFWAVCTLVTFIVLFEENDGVVRGFFILGNMIGMILYRLLLGQLLVPLTSKLLLWIKQKIVKVTKKISRPMKNKLTSFIKGVKIMLCKR